MMLTHIAVFKKDDSNWPPFFPSVKWVQVLEMALCHLFTYFRLFWNVFGIFKKPATKTQRRVFFWCTYILTNTIYVYIYIMYTIFAHRLGLEQTPSWKKCWQSNMDAFKSSIWLTLRYLGFHVCRVLNFPSKRHVPFPTTTAKQSKPCNGQPTRRKPGRA